ncbi:Fructose-bisphosphate aldolase 3, chloroplastic [Asimina triloba]
MAPPRSNRESRLDYINGLSRQLQSIDSQEYRSRDREEPRKKESESIVDLLAGMASMSMAKLNASSSPWIGQQSFNSSRATRPSPSRFAVPIRAAAGSYTDELKTIASPGRGILAIDESNATCGKRLSSIGLDNTEANRQAYRQLLLTTPGLGEYISGAILFEETLYQSTTNGKKFVDCLRDENIMPGIKVDKGLVPLPGSNDESWCQGLDGLASRSAEYYKQGARFAKWRTVVSIPCGPSALAVKEAAWGLARYAAISQDNGLVPIVEPEILLDGDHSIDRTLEVAERVWAEVFYYLAENNVIFEGILLKPSMVTPGAEYKEKASPETIAKYTLKMLNRRVPPAVPGIMVLLDLSSYCFDRIHQFVAPGNPLKLHEWFLSGGQSEVEATLNLNAMNQSPNPWHVSFSYARALQNTVLKMWQGRPENVEAAQKALLVRAKANSLAQLGQYTSEGESDEAKKGMFVKGYTY